MMRIVLYCRELRASGGKSVGTSLVRALAARKWPHEIYALVPDDYDYTCLSGGSVKVIPSLTRGGVWQLSAHWKLKSELHEIGPDVLYMLGNRALGHPPCPQAVYFHQPWAVYPNSEAWRRYPQPKRVMMKLRVAIINKSLGHAHIVTTQTPVMMERLHKLCGVPRDRLVLIPNAVTPTSLPESQTVSQAADTIRESPHRTRVICVARHMAHKNLEILLDVADVLLNMERRDVGIFVTVDESHGSGARRFLNLAKKTRRSEIIHNLGEIPMFEVPACYTVSDGMILPSLLESFSGTYVDAMHLGIPVITSDMDFAHTVCGNAAMYVDPLDAHSIAQCLLSLADKREEWCQRIEKGKQRAAEVSMSWDTIADRVIDMMESMYFGRSSAEQAVKV